MFDHKLIPGVSHANPAYRTTSWSMEPLWDPSSSGSMSQPPTPGVHSEEERTPPIHSGDSTIVPQNPFDTYTTPNKWIMDQYAFSKYYEILDNNSTNPAPSKGCRCSPGRSYSGQKTKSKKRGQGSNVHQHGSPPSGCKDGLGGRICSPGGLLSWTIKTVGLGVPHRLESLLKLIAQSLHLVFATVCSRKARRKDRESPSALDHEHKIYLEEAVLERSLPQADLRCLVDLPPGLGYEEWLASHTIDFFQHINLLYGTICEFCTLAECPDMIGPGLRHYLWFDDKGKKTRVAATQYVDYVMTFTQNTVNDETIFPTKFENDFPTSFESIVKKIHRLLFHVLAHLYHSHFREMVLLSLHTHLNCTFAHFILFNERFNLMDEKETEILEDLVRALKLRPQDEQDASVDATLERAETNSIVEDSICDSSALDVENVLITSTMTVDVSSSSGVTCTPPCSTVSLDPCNPCMAPSSHCTMSGDSNSSLNNRGCFPTCTTSPSNNNSHVNYNSQDVTRVKPVLEGFPVVTRGVSVTDTRP